MRTPRAVRPLQYEYVVLGGILKDLGEDLYATTRRDFLSLCMLRSRGAVNPHRIERVYDELMREAGLPPLEETE